MALSSDELRRLLALLRAAGVDSPIVQGIDTLRRIIQTATRGRNLSADAQQVLTILRQIEREQQRLAAIERSGNPPLQAPPPLFPQTRSIGSGSPPRLPGRLTGPDEPGGFGSNLRTRAPQGFPEEHQLFSDEFLAPTSTNVYSFQYFRRPGDTLGILYVTFKGHKVKGQLGPPRHPGGRAQLHGRPGRTLGERVNKPGSTYAYYDVGVDVFNRMKMAHSKGKFVWDELRIRGTVYGHQYRYSLVSGQLLKTGRGGLTQYIPRKATRRGFVTRSLADIGTRRRGFVSSTLPPAYVGGQGFSTRGR